MREWENATWATGQTAAQVIEKVGAKVAETATRLTNPRDHITILAGKGNNGADARAASKQISNRTVAIFDITDPATDLEALNFILIKHRGLIVDGLFGVGLNRELDNSWRKIIEAINSSGPRVLAVDVPSGLNADTGLPMGAAIRASVTLTIGAPKCGLIGAGAAEYVGRLEVADDVGLVRCHGTSDLQWTMPKDFRDFPPARKVETHKGTYGHLAIVAGSAGYHGAAVLCSKGAQRAQPGLITLFAHQPIYVPVASQCQAVMVSPWSKDIILPDNCTAVLIGPGLADPNLPPEIRSWTEQLWRESSVPIIVDASALSWLPRHTHPIKGVRVITPHPGEAGKMLESSAAKVQSDRPRALRKLSQEHGNALVILKGNQTLIGRSIGEISVNCSGNPHLAQGGSGDVLSGYIAGLLAQPDLATDPIKTLSFAVWQHGATADHLQHASANWTIEGLHAMLGSIRP
jgi:NAD(P)H-hydrate epimerase